jgi:hypothetical protein
MPKSTDRFYQVPLGNRHALFGDLGSHLQISGVIFQGNNSTINVLLPHYQDTSENHVIRPSQEEWEQIIQHSDNPSIFEIDPTGGVKAVHRKVRYQISGEVQQGIWARDGFKCMYCERKMGETLMSIDHFVPLELGGKNDTTNYLSACKKCNKRKANNPPNEWCGPPHTINSYQWYLEYLKQQS